MSTVEPRQPRCGEEMATGTTSAMLVVGCHHFYLFYVVGSHHFYLFHVVGSHHFCVPTIILSLVHIPSNQVSMSQASITK